MKKLLLAALIVMVMLGLSSTAKAYVLLPPGGDSTGDASPGGTILAQIIDEPFIGVDIDNVEYFRGLFTHYVRENSNGLLFTYQFTLTSGTDPVNDVTVTNFSGFDTYGDVVDILGDDLGKTLGGSISWHLGTDVMPPDQAQLPGAATSPLFWVQTDAHYYKLGSTVIQDGGNARLRSYAPNAVPEPGTMLLLGLGVLGLFGIGRKRI